MASDQPNLQTTQIVPFGRRVGPPRACVLDHKPHVRSFLAGMLDELGFATRDCGAPDFKKILSEFTPDLVVLGPLNGAAEVSLLIQALVFTGYGGRAMLFGGRHSDALMEMQELGERVGLAMLPPLGTPFRDGTLAENVACFLPIIVPADMAVDADEALRNGWLEMWYQPKIDPHSLSPSGAEALVRVRHPNWGLVSPSSFVGGGHDPYLRTFSQYIIMRAMADSVAFAAARHPIDISVDLPGAALNDVEFADKVLQAIPDHGAKRGLQIEVRSADIAGNLPRLRHVAGQLAFRNIGISIDDVGREGALLAAERSLPVVELKVGRRYVRGCATDRVKQAVCSEIIAAAQANGARSVAIGVDTHADFVAARELGFDLLQGALFAKPMELRAFERTLGARPA
jgi:EAL domain-containing protein (putative c-di-GMP-specific phosphodiesterase class I)